MQANTVAWINFTCANAVDRLGAHDAISDVKGSLSELKTAVKAFEESSLNESSKSAMDAVRALAKAQVSLAKLRYILGEKQVDRATVFEAQQTEARLLRAVRRDA